MKIISWLVDKEKRFAWSLFGTLVGIVSLAFAYYALQEKKSNIEFVTTNEANVLDVHTPVEDLQIKFQGQNLQEGKQNLRILTVRVENKGDVDILQNYYDQNRPWGFQVQPGRIIEARLIGSNSDYLKETLRPIVTSDSVNFNKVIFERGKFVIIEVLTIHGKGVDPQIRPFGKIAGIEKLSNFRTNSNATDKTFWNRVVGGSIAVQAVRTLTYTFSFIILIATLGGIAAFLSSMRDKRKRGKRTKQISALKIQSKHKESHFETLSKTYIQDGKEGLNVTRFLLTNQDELRKHVQLVRSIEKKLHIEQKEFQQLSDKDQAVLRHRMMRTAREDTIVYNDIEFRIAKRLLTNHIIHLKKDGSTTISPGVIELIDELIKSLN